MARKLGKKEIPSNHSASDFECFGPAATKDGEFESCKIADLGCFNQAGIDSNKYYHASICRSKKNSVWFTYFEWGRTGATSPDFQFVECSSESEAQTEFVKQLLAKNVKRGVWTTIAGIKTLKPKPGEESCYLVRPLVTRSVGLPDARTIKTNDTVKKLAGPTAPPAPKKQSSVDPQTLSLIRDLKMATIAYTKGVMADSSLPTQSCIDEARSILTEAEKRLLKVGYSLTDQEKDQKLYEYTTLLFSRIPKRKPVGAPVSTWVLTQNNILAWRQDLDAFESALTSSDTIGDIEVDPLAGMNLRMEWLSPTGKIGKFIKDWMPTASANKHDWVGNMIIKNIWKVDRIGASDLFKKQQLKILSDNPKTNEKPKWQPDRVDVPPSERNDYKNSNTALLFHGTRSVNVAPILQTGLRLPKELVGVVITGALLGGGAYYAADWRKSAGYTSLKGSYWSGGDGAIKGRNAFIFLVDVALGSMYTAPKTFGYTSPPKGYHSVYGKSGFTDMGYGDKLKNDEFVIYNTNQNNIQYLVEFSTTK